MNWELWSQAAEQSKSFIYLLEQAVYFSRFIDNNYYFCTKDLEDWP